MRKRCAGIGTRIADGLRQGIAAALPLVAFGSAQSVPAATLSYAGSFAQDDDVVLFPFTVSDPSDATFRTLSYGGGTDANGDPVSSGGFDPVLSLFDGTGDLLIFVDDGAEPDIASDPTTGLALDSYFTWSVAPGDYTLALSQSNNYPGLTLSDLFSRAGEGNFTETYGCGAGSFYDFSCSGRAGNYQVEILNVAAIPPPPPPPMNCGGIEEPPCEATPVPLPPALWSFLGGLPVLLLGRCGPRRNSRRHAALRRRRAVVTSGIALFAPIGLTATSALGAQQLSGGGYEAESIEEIKSLEAWFDEFLEYAGGPFTYVDAVADIAKVMDKAFDQAGDACGPTESQGGITCYNVGDLETRRISNDPTVIEPVRLYTHFLCSEQFHKTCKDPEPPYIPITWGGTVGSGYFLLQKCPISLLLTKVDGADADKPGYYTGNSGLIQQYPPSDPAKVTEVYALTKKLEEGVSGYDLLSDAMKSTVACMETKFAAVGVPFSRADIKGTVRTRAYQKHFVDIVKTDVAMKNAIGKDPKNALRCADVVNAVYTEQFVSPRKYNQGHGRITSPAEDKSNHENGNAIDIYPKKANDLAKRLKTSSTPNVNDYLADCAGPGMQIQWGQYFKNSQGKPLPDPVHYQLVPKP